jgi:hypothetical protein
MNRYSEYHTSFVDINVCEIVWQLSLWPSKTAQFLIQFDKSNDGSTIGQAHK